jgi:hypothetical protein
VTRIVDLREDRFAARVVDPVAHVDRRQRHGGRAAVRDPERLRHVARAAVLARDLELQLLGGEASRPRWRRSDHEADAADDGGAHLHATALMHAH